MITFLSLFKYAGVAELAVFLRARPVDEEASEEKAQRSKFFAVSKR